MANPEHLEILKQGVDVWNKWRDENPEIRPDLTEADMRKGDFKKADFHRVNFTGASFEDSDLSEADFFMASAIFAIFNNTDLSGSNLNHANLQETELDGADLSGADLIFTNFNQSSLSNASFNRAIFGWTSLGLLDFSRVTGLDSAIHEGPSILGIDSILKSKGEIPESFLRGCGLPEDFIKLIPSLICQPFQFCSCFISYSSYDDDFARRLHADLRANNVSVWFAPEDLKIGDRIRDRIDHSIRIHDKLLLILTEQSIQSDWVEKEVETAFEKERKNPGKAVLFPIRLDDAVMDTGKAWAADIRRTRHIGDFTDWKNHDSYKKAFDRLLRDLKASEE